MPAQVPRRHPARCREYARRCFPCRAAIASRFLRFTNYHRVSRHDIVGKKRQEMGSVKSGRAGQWLEQARFHIQSSTLMQSTAHRHGRAFLISLAPSATSATFGEKESNLPDATLQYIRSNFNACTFIYLFGDWQMRYIDFRLSSRALRCHVSQTNSGCLFHFTSRCSSQEWRRARQLYALAITHMFSL